MIWKKITPFEHSGCIRICCFASNPWLPWIHIENAVMQIVQFPSFSEVARTSRCSRLTASRSGKIHIWAKVLRLNMFFAHLWRFMVQIDLEIMTAQIGI